MKEETNRRQESIKKGERKGIAISDESVEGRKI